MPEFMYNGNFQCLFIIVVLAVFFWATRNVRPEDVADIYTTSAVDRMVARGYGADIRELYLNNFDVNVMSSRARGEMHRQGLLPLTKAAKAYITSIV